MAPDGNIIIKGESLTLGVGEDDYTVLIGADGLCSVEVLQSRFLQCSPPDQRPSVEREEYMRVDGETCPQIKVRFTI